MPVHFLFHIVVISCLPFNVSSVKIQHSDAGLVHSYHYLSDGEERRENINPNTETKNLLGETENLHNKVKDAQEKKAERCSPSGEISNVAIMNNGNGCRPVSPEPDERAVISLREQAGGRIVRATDLTERLNGVIENFEQHVLSEEALRHPEIIYEAFRTQLFEFDESLGAFQGELEYFSDQVIGFYLPQRPLRRFEYQLVNLINDQGVGMISLFPRWRALINNIEIVSALSGTQHSELLTALNAIENEHRADLEAFVQRVRNANQRNVP